MGGFFKRVTKSTKSIIKRATNPKNIGKSMAGPILKDTMKADPVYQAGKKALKPKMPTSTATPANIQEQADAISNPTDQEGADSQIITEEQARRARLRAIQGGGGRSTLNLAGSAPVGQRRTLLPKA